MRVTRIAGREIRDAKKDITITVTKGDVNHASLKNPASCAMARACNRQEGKEARIHVSRVYLAPNGSKYWSRYVVPQRLRTEIISFDRGGLFAPDTYTLLAPTRSKVLGYSSTQLPRDHGNRGNRKRKKIRGPKHIVKDIRTGPANGV